MSSVFGCSLIALKIQLLLNSVIFLFFLNMRSQTIKVKVNKLHFYLQMHYMDIFSPTFEARGSTPPPFAEMFEKLCVLTHFQTVHMLPTIHVAPSR